MENIKEIIRLMAAILIFLTASALVFLVIHSVSHVVGGFSLFAIAIIVVVAFFFIVLLCTYQCGDRTLNRILDRSFGENRRFNGVSVIQVPYRYDRTQTSYPPESPCEITQRIYAPPWRSDNDLPPYIDDPPPDYYTAIGKSPENGPCQNNPITTVNIVCENDREENTTSNQGNSETAINVQQCDKTTDSTEKES